MYLSRLILNPRIRRVQRELVNPYELHRTLVTQCFSGALAGGKGERILFRVDVDAHTGAPTLLLQSHSRPDWAWLGAPNAQGYLLGAPETKSFDLALLAGQTLAFRLRANPTKKHWRADKPDDPNEEKKPHRDPLYREEEQIDWLKRKGEQGGFRVLHLSVASEGDHVAWQSVEAGPRRKLTMLAVRFDGLLQVTDPTKLRETVRQGIGSGKGLGFGLLSLARV